MTIRRIIPTTVVVEGIALQLNLIQNPNIDDAVMTEMKVYANALAKNELSTLEARRIDRGLREYLTKEGLQR
jgi:hypothetical protein